jgi:hypothetical protein
MTPPPPGRLAAIVCLAGLAIAVCGCGGSDDPLLGVLKRADAADTSFGVRYTFRARTDDEGKTYRTRGYGQAEASRRRERIVVVDRVSRGVTIVDGDDNYSGGSLAVPGLFDTPARNIRWTKVDGSRFLDAGYIDYVCGRDLPAKLAGVLAESDPAIERLRPARIGTVRMQRYRVTTTSGRVLDVLPGDDDASGCPDRGTALTAELWIDRRDLVRRVRLRYETADGHTVETRDITRYDRAVRVAVPSGPTVADITDKLLELADSLCKSDPDVC